MVKVPTVWGQSRLTPKALLLLFLVQPEIQICLQILALFTRWCILTMTLHFYLHSTSINVACSCLPTHFWSDKKPCFFFNSVGKKFAALERWLIELLWGNHVGFTSPRSHPGGCLSNLLIKFLQIWAHLHKLLNEVCISREVSTGKMPKFVQIWAAMVQLLNEPWSKNICLQ